MAGGNFDSESSTEAELEYLLLRLEFDGRAHLMMASRFRRRVVTVLLVLYAMFVMLITLTPTMPGTGLVSRLVGRLLVELKEHGVTGVHFLDVEFFGNVVMFVPLGVFAALLVPRRAWWTLLFMGTIFSGFIELFQATFLPDRFPEVRDLISNTTGFLIGAVASLSLRLIVSHRDSLVELDRRASEMRVR